MGSSELSSGILVKATLRDELTGKCLPENGLPQAVGAGEVGFDGGFEFVDDGQAALDFVDNAVLLGLRWDRKQY